MRSSLQDSREIEDLDDLPGVPAGMGEPIHDPLAEGSELDGQAVDGDSDSAGQDHTTSSKPFRPKLDQALTKGYTEAATAAVHAVGGVLNSAAAQDEEDDIWLPTDEETDQIAEPLGRIAARHIPTPAGDMDPGDIADAIGIVVGLVIYGIRNLNETFRRRRDRRRTIQGVVQSEAA